MGFKSDQALPSEQHDLPPPPPYRPPLPPRDLTASSFQTAPGASQYSRPSLPPRDSSVYDLPERPLKIHARPTNLSWIEQDPRSRSTESLVPHDESGIKRVLLIVYIHGFVGDETSFQSFPAHIHNLATQLLEETHVVHTKIYPKYKSRKNISFARDDFSKWLVPHESERTDVVLVGHSMGGILASDVVLLLPLSRTNTSPFFHRILGSINFDTPFLGMHPGVIKAGLGSLFRPSSPTPKPRPDQVGSSDSLALTQSQTGDGQSATYSQNASLASTTSLSSILAEPSNDPNYNPSFPNDVRMQKRKGKENIMHFLNKHSDNLAGAAKSYVTSHLEFGGAMADYKTLHARYKKVRALESWDGRQGGAMTGSQALRRVRFVNYYTASTGRIKPEPKSPYRGRPLSPRPQTPGLSADNAHGSASDQSSRSRSTSPLPGQGSRRQSAVAGDGTRRISMQASSRASLDQSRDSRDMAYLEPRAEEHDEADSTQAITATENTDMVIPSIVQRAATQELELPPLGPEPTQPQPFDPDRYQDEDIRKIAEKDHKRAVKAYNSALKDREEAVKDRQKLMEKREKSLKKLQDKQVKEQAKRQKTEDKEVLKSIETDSHPTADENATAQDGSRGPGSTESEDEIQTADLNDAEAPAKKKKDRKFCVLPSKGQDGQRDPTWVRVYMEGVDEVGAHMGLFFTQNPHYEKLVSDVGQLILTWVEDDMRARGD